MAAALGSIVKYISTKGYEKVALVTGTPESVSEGTSLAENYPLNAEQEQVHLTVFSPGSVSPRLQVPSKAAVEGIEDFAQGGYYIPLA